MPAAPTDDITIFSSSVLYVSSHYVYTVYILFQTKLNEFIQTVDWWGYVSDLRPPTDLLFFLQVVYKCGEPRWNDIHRGEQNNSEKSLSQCHFCPPQIPNGLTRARFRESGERPETYRMSHSTVSMNFTRFLMWNDIRLFINLWSADHWWCAAVRQMVHGGPKAVSEDKRLQKLYQTLYEWKIQP
jgi:hypothetical protein